MLIVVPAAIGSVTVGLAAAMASGVCDSSHSGLAHVFDHVAHTVLAHTIVYEHANSVAPRPVPQGTRIDVQLVGHIRRSQPLIEIERRAGRLDPASAAVAPVGVQLGN